MISFLVQNIKGLEVVCYMDYLLQVRSMKFSKDVRKQLSQIIQKIAKGQFSTFCFMSNS
jgi:hypothetical protein